MACAICLEEMTPEQDVCSLSCDHTFHRGCYRILVLQTGHTFVKCPLCREMNTKHPRVPEKSAGENLKLWFQEGGRCCAKTKKGTRCTRKARFLNNGCCATHNKNILPADKYQVYSEYVWYTLGSTNYWSTKMYMFDISRKLLVAHPEISSLYEIHHYMLRYFQHCHHGGMTESEKSNPKKIYIYYDIPFPSKTWIRLGIQDKELV
jgi:hypothetical protein